MLVLCSFNYIIANANLETEATRTRKVQAIVSWCWTLIHTGMLQGIEVSGYYKDQPFVGVGAAYTRHTKGTLNWQPNRVLFHKFNPPMLRDGRLRTAQIKHHGGKPYLRYAEADKGMLVLVDTGHTFPCESGGSWLVNDKNLVKEITSGYKDSSDSVPPQNSGAQKTCYKVGLFVLQPGGRLTVSFNTPGTLTAEVAFDGDWPSFHITESVTGPSAPYSGTSLFYDPFENRQQ